MHPLDSLVGLANFAAKNTAYNLKFIPSDKLNWKPAPTANSALEIVTHVTGAMTSMLPALAGGEWTPPQVTPPTTLDEAQELLTTTAEKYAAALVQIPPQELGKNVTVFGGLTAPLARAASMPVVDLIHHHGQIAYIQTLLGDVDMHFYESGS
jgi:hypothetical protein